MLRCLAKAPHPCPLPPAFLQVFKGGLSRTGMEEGEQFRYFAQQASAACMAAPCILRSPTDCGARPCHSSCCFVSAHAPSTRPTGGPWLLEDWRACPVQILLLSAQHARLCWHQPSPPPWWPPCRQELRDLFRLELPECEASRTQRELHAMHAHQRRETPELRRHLEYLATLDCYAGRVQLGGNNRGQGGLDGGCILRC